MKCCIAHTSIQFNNLFAEQKINKERLLKPSKYQKCIERVVSIGIASASQNHAIGRGVPNDVVDVITSFERKKTCFQYCMNIKRFLSKVCVRGSQLFNYEYLNYWLEKVKEK